jgi:hypothetical protein
MIQIVRMAIATIPGMKVVRLGIAQHLKQKHPRPQSRLK